MPCHLSVCPIAFIIACLLYKILQLPIDGNEHTYTYNRDKRDGHRRQGSGVRHRVMRRYNAYGSHVVNRVSGSSSRSGVAWLRELVSGGAFLGADGRHSAPVTALQQADATHIAQARWSCKGGITQSRFGRVEEGALLESHTRAQTRTHTGIHIHMQLHNQTYRNHYEEIPSASR